MTDFLPWSHSRRHTYKDCPKQLFHTAVARKGTGDRVEYVQSQAAADGDAIDRALSARIRDATPLPPGYQPYEGICELVLSLPGTKFTQMRLAFDRAFQPCGYMDWDRTWLRVIYDLAIVNPAEKHADIWDWKNGKVWIDEDQLMLFAATGFLIWPEVDTINTKYVWLQHGIISPKSYRRRDAPEMWAALLPDIERMQTSFKTNHWPAAPARGKASCGWCSVNKAGKCAAALCPPK